MTGRVLQRVVLPVDADLDVLPLYVEGGRGASRSEDGTVVVSDAGEEHAEHVLGRRSLLVPAGTRASFATYFNAFPASYWRRWTVVESVVLRVQVSGPATVLVYRSTATGTTERVDAVVTTGKPLELTLPLTPFADGGWYWFDLVAGREDAVLDSAEWVSGNLSADADEPGTLTIAVTTFNRPASLVQLLQQLAGAPDTLDVVDEVLVVDQGTERVRAQEGFAAVDGELGGRLRVIEQGNVGGSGGFSRGMLETLASGRSRYVLLLDDDVSAEPECVLRGLAFADLCREPTLVGGHMLSLYARSTLHSFGERVDRWRFWWGPVRTVVPEHDLGRAGLRATPWLHRRTDVDYNGWWMCLIPVEVLKTVGLSLPLFIKWDDAEYGLRAAEAGFPTVSLPGMAIWHVPWTEKDDALDWQAYFHQRNRLVAALLHSPYPRGGRLVRESLNHQIKHLLSMQYSVAELRVRAMEDVLSGPDHLHAGLPTVLATVRSVRKEFPDAQTAPGPVSYPAVRRTRPPRKDREPEAPRGLLGMALTAAVGAVKQLRPVSAGGGDHPQASVPAQDAQWWRLAALDSALVSTADGRGVAWYRRDRAAFTDLLRRSVEVHERLFAQWPALAESYRGALPELTSVESWQRTLELTGGHDHS